MCFLDLVKAFDTVSHVQLLEALDHFGVRGRVHDLFTSYLSDRKQFVKINNSISNYRVVQYGVPQGTVLGPILFIMYINHLLNIRSTGKIISFADDTAIFYEASSWADLKIKVENDLKNLINWFDHKLLTINYKKTTYIPFSCNKRNSPDYDKLEIYSNDYLIEINSSDFTKYLGVYIDKHLRWDIHINTVAKTLRSLLYKFKFLNKILDVKQMKIIYHALVESRLSYGILGWGGALNIHMKTL